MNHPIITKIRSKKEQFHHCSSKTMITFFVLIFILPLIVLQIATSTFSLNIYRSQTTQTIKQMASYFLSETDDSLNSITHFLAKTASENYEFGRIAYDMPGESEKNEYELFKTRFYLSMRQSIDYYPNAQYIFFYQKHRNDLLLVSPPNYMSSTASVSYSTMSEYLADYFSAYPSPQKEWELVTIDGQTELMRIFSFGDSYLGASVPISTLLQKLEKYNLGNCTFQITNSKYSSASAPHTFMSLNSSQIQLDSSAGNYAIFLTVTQKEFFTPALIAFLSILLLSILMLCLIPLSQRFLRKQFYTPLEIMVAHMKNIENGNTTALLPNELGGPETTQVARSFNQMMEQIQNLKIQVYEKKIAQSQLELQCLHLQLNPHFFLNTLNSAYLLVKTGDLDNLQTLLKSLTGYFRSIFQSDSESTLLSLQLEQCQNYIYIYQIRCFKRIQVVFDIDQELLVCHIPSMCILTFMENSIKYAVDDLDKLRITVSVHRCLIDDNPYMEIIIRDNGTGFPDDILARLNKEFTMQQLTGSHIGIRNLQHRLYYLYKERASISFTNEVSSGAKTTILIPLSDNTI